MEAPQQKHIEDVTDHIVNLSTTWRLVLQPPSTHWFGGWVGRP